MAGETAGVFHTRHRRSTVELSDASYREVFHRAPVGSGIADADGSLLDFNDALLLPGGFSREELERLGHVGRLCASPTDWERIRRRFRLDGSVSREEVRFRRRDGSAYDALVGITPVRFHGEPCLYLTVEDVTDRKREEARRDELAAQLWQAQKMAAIGELTAGIAHDFNSILSVITVNVELLKTAVNPEDAQAVDDLNGIRDAALKATRMVGRLLGFSRHAALTLRPEDLRHVATAVGRTTLHVLPPTVQLEIDVGSTPLVSLCDAAAVEHMVLNLVTNARDAMPEGGTIKILVDAHTVEADAPDRPPWMEPAEYVRISVVDEGTGMDPETLGRVFEPFFSTKAPGSGTGLGMSAVYGLAKQQGGYVVLTSALWRGTTASLYFPRERPSDVLEW